MLKWALDYAKGEVYSGQENSFCLSGHWSRNCPCLSGPSGTVADGLARDIVLVSGPGWVGPCLQGAPREEEGTGRGMLSVASLCFASASVARGRCSVSAV